MFSVILCLLLLLLCSMGLGILMNRKTDTIIPVLFMGIIVCLFFFYILDLLAVGKYVLYAGIFAVFVLASRRIRGLLREGRSFSSLFFQKLFTPGVALLLFLAIVFIVFAWERKPAVWDELRLWAAMPKALHFSSALQVGEDSLLYSTMQSYPPGISLLVWFFTAFSSGWSYGSTYAVYWIFFAAMFLPAFQTMRWKYWHYLPLTAFLITGGAVFLTLSGREPSGDYAFFFGSLYIDPFIGCVLGHGLFRMVRKPFRGKFSLLGFSFTLFVLSTMKNVAALYAAVLFVASLILWILEKNAGKKRIWWFLFPMLSAGVPYAIWQWIIHTKGTGEFIDFNMTGLTAEKVLNVLKGLSSWGVIPFLVFAVFFVVAEILMTKFFKDIPRREAVFAMCALALSLLLFLYGYTSHYGTMLSSIHRYTSCFTFAAFVYLFSRCITKMKRPLKDELGRTILLSALFLFATGFVLVYGQERFLSNDGFPDAELLRETAEQAADDSSTADHPAKTYLALGGDIRKESQLHETCALELIGSPLNIRNIWCDRLYNEAEDGVITDREEMTRIWAGHLVSGSYTYVAVLHPDDDILYAIQKIAPSLTLPEDPCILRVLPSDNTYGITLQIS